MQVLAGGFHVKRSHIVYEPGGISRELFELPNGQWQFGKGRDASVITSLEDIAAVTDHNIRSAVEAWLERTKGQALQPVQQGATPLLAGTTVKDKLSLAISRMPEDVAARLLGSIEQVLGSVVDSISQADTVNHHGDGYGQDQAVIPPGAVPFNLPEGAIWAQPGNPTAGYLVPDLEIKDERGKPSMRWHPTPQFEQFIQAAPEKTPVEIEMDEEREKHQERELVGAGGRATKSRRR